MESKRDVKSIADDVATHINNVKTLLSAVDDKVRFYLMDKNNSGPYWELMKHHAMEIQTLLSITEGIVCDMKRDQDLVTDILYGIRKGLAHERTTSQKTGSDADREAEAGINPAGTYFDRAEPGEGGR